jgi:DNA transformation protein
MSKEFVEYIIEILEPFGNIKARKMFGGYGIYKNMLMFALIADNELYFKADSDTAKYFKSQDLEPFTYQAKGKLIALSYYKISPEIIEDGELLTKYFNMAYSSALNSDGIKAKNGK